MTILINEKGIKIFQLSKNEIRILHVLYNNDPLLLSQLVRTTKIPRMTLYPIIKKLKDRGLIKNMGPKSQIRWFIISENDIIEILKDLINSKPSEPRWSPSSPGYQL